MNLRYKLFAFLLLILTGCKATHTVKNTKTSLYKNGVFACYYHNKYNGRKTANGETFSNKKLTAAHKKLPFGTRIKVTNPQNDKNVVVTINDRGPFTKGFEIDLSKKAFDQITHDPKAGKIKVKLEIITDSR
ncbi:MAG TPA: septal ring lytic transglycosylase RlpA family protein [Flavobacterium sp.]|nr:septal ring lytic transglycosylase RlpA family protein [Flavobacterium sp.]